MAHSMSLCILACRGKLTETLPWEAHPQQSFRGLDATAYPSPLTESAIKFFDALGHSEAQEY